MHERIVNRRAEWRHKFRHVTTAKFLEDIYYVVYFVFCVAYPWYWVMMTILCGVFQQLLLERLLHHLRTTLPVEGPPNKKKKQPKPGAPKENIVQIHLNIALLNVFWYLTVDMGIFFSPKNFSSVRIS